MRSFDRIIAHFRAGFTLTNNAFVLYYYINKAQLQVNTAKKLHIGDYLGLKNVKNNKCL